MADKGNNISETVTASKPLTPAQKQLIKRQRELEQWKNNSKKLRGRNLITGLAIGAFVVGMCILAFRNGIQYIVSYTILSVKQERIMDEIDDEAKIFIMRGPRTGANS